MRIEFVEIGNFRKLLSTRVGLSSEKTVFVGANNSGKTSIISRLSSRAMSKKKNTISPSLIQRMSGLSIASVPMRTDAGR